MIEPSKLIYEFDEFRIDVLKRQLTRGEIVVPLNSKAFDLLLVLVENTERVLTKDELLKSVWEGQILEEANLPVHVSNIRKALGDKANQPRYIITIPGRGYRFIANVTGFDNSHNGFLIKSQSISRITVEEETEITDDDLTIDSQEISLLQGERNESLAVMESSKIIQSEEKQIAHAALPSNTFFNRHKLLTAFLIIFSIATTTAAIYFYRRANGAKGSPVKFQQISIQQLTNNGVISEAALSPDGKFFVYTLVKQDKQSLWLRQIDETQAIQLRPPEEVIYRSLFFSRDGKNIFYTLATAPTSGFNLYKQGVLGGTPEKLFDGINEFFSLAPDNKRVAFVRNNETDKTSKLIISNLDGSNETAAASLALERGFNERSLAWSPDGEMIAFGTRKDGSATEDMISVCRLKDGEIKALSQPLWRYIGRIEWLNDNSGVVFLAEDKDPQESRQLWLVEYPQGTARHITNDITTYSANVSTASDSRRILTIQLQQLNNIWISPADDLSKAKQITFGTFNRNDGLLGFDWTPDGKIVYVATVGRSQTIWMMNADGSDAKQLTPAGYSDTMPSVTADGRQIVFASNRSGAKEIWRAAIDGSDIKQLTNCGQNEQPSLSPDGKWIIYKSLCDGVGGLWRMPLSGGEPVRLTDKKAEWSWVSPDSKWIACEYFESLRKSRLAIISIDGGKPAKVFDVARLANFRYGIRWSPDGKSITYRDWGTGLWQQAIDGGAPKQIEDFPKEKNYGFGWSRDGKLFAFTRGEEIRNAVLIKSEE